MLELYQQISMIVPSTASVRSWAKAVLETSSSHRLDTTSPHERTSRSSRFNCAPIPETLLESDPVDVFDYWSGPPDRRPAKSRDLGSIVIVLDTGLHGGQQRGGDVRFRDIPSGARAHRVLGHVPRIVLAEDEDADTRRFSADDARSLETAQSRHGDVEKDEVRFQLLRHLDRFDAVFRLAANLPVRSGGQERMDTAPHQLVVVRDQDP